MGKERLEYSHARPSTKSESPGQSLELHIHTLGVPEVLLEKAPLHFSTKKALALLVYLAVSGTPQPREHLASLLWPDRSSVPPAAKPPVDQWLRGGHDRLGRDCLRLELSSEASAARHSLASVRTTAGAVERISAERALGTDDIGVRLDLDLVEQAAAIRHRFFGNA